ncbi:hypothetical protein [Sporomusa termitida]|uniref:Uncharacterized protein n=1 Tax=Sporomusa termitida TaxID=2377 RepID=A0A517E098_9FIRM|nr:hypothetical protein [Sporomusa termitida]QDR83034.1 hypothetical protein SPTER_44960 [Sporomusa termitida]
MVTDMKESLLSKLTARIQEQLVVNGITDFRIADGNFHFANVDDKSRANAIIRDYLTYLLDKDAECLM